MACMPNVESSWEKKKKKENKSYWRYFPDVLKYTQLSEKSVPKRHMYSYLKSKCKLRPFPSWIQDSQTCVCKKGKDNTDKQKYKDTNKQSQIWLTSWELELCKYIY